MNLKELLFILNCIVAIEVAGNNVNILITRIPVGVLIIATAIAIVVLGGPYPDEVANTFLFEIVKHSTP